MQKRSLFTLMTLLIFTCFLGQLFGQTSTTNKEQPNIIFILTDDQRFDALGYAVMN